MTRDAPDTHRKALEMNLDTAPYGTFAEIGAGQEVARWFFRVGGAAGTVAKTMSAYDMAVSDAIYGRTERYVSRQRLQAMLRHEYGLLLQRLHARRGATSTFFVFADTVATRSYARHRDGDGWMGVRFQHEPQAPPSEILVHAHLRDRESVHEQEALGILGVNLVYGAFRRRQEAPALIASLMDALSRDRVEIDMIRFSGPAFEGLDNRLMSLQLVQQHLTDATLFTADGEVMQPSEVLHGRTVLVERGSFRPVVRPALDMLEAVRGCLARERAAGKGNGAEEPLVIMEMTLHNLMATDPLTHCDFLALADMLGGLGATVMISNYGRHDELSAFLRRHTRERILFAMGVPGVRELFDEKYYTDVGGGIAEALGRLFQKGVTLFAYPYRDATSEQLLTAQSLQVAAHLRQLYAYFLENGFIQPLEPVDEEYLHVLPHHVRTSIREGDPRWEKMVPREVVSLIRKCGCKGLEPLPETAEGVES